MDYKLLISVAAIIIALFNLGWNIRNKIKSEKKKLLIQSFKIKSTEKTTCTITLTNIGRKPIYVRSIQIEEKINEKIEKRNTNYSEYKEKIENKPINPEDWRTINLHDTKYFTFFDLVNIKLLE
jgi:hypothetical protein